MDSIPYSAARLKELPQSRIFVVATATTVSIAGPGAVTCLQGLLTNDVAGGTDRLIYGALLTAKGMIAVDYWTFRIGEGFVLVAEASAREASAELFRRQLPPRLARASDRSTDWRALWVLGSHAAVAAAAEIDLPPPGNARLAGDLLVGAGTERTPFRALIVGPEAAIESLAARLLARGARAGDSSDLRAARVLAGAPTLGPEIDDRTLPQEVGFDELDGISYTKGCYVGQETVARLHFRGHANWQLRSIAGSGIAETAPSEIEVSGKVVARIGTLLRLDDGSVRGLAKVRREIELGAQLPYGGGTLAVGSARNAKSPDPAGDQGSPDEPPTAV